MLLKPLLAALLGALLTASPLDAAPPAGSAAEPAAFSAETAPGTTPVRDIWDAVLQKRLDELAAVQENLAALRQRLPAEAKELAGKLGQIEQDYARAAGMARLSRTRPVELSIVEKNIALLQKRLEEARAPLQTSMDYLSAQHEDLTRLNTSDAFEPTGANDSAVTQVQTEIRKLLQSVTSLRRTVTLALLPLNGLEKKMAAQRDALKADLPALWKAYYLAPAERLFSPESWTGAGQSFRSLRASSEVRLLAKLPADLSSWLAILVRMLTVLLPVYALLTFARHATAALPPPFANGCGRICRSCLPWVGWGLACHISAWTGGGLHYPAFSVLGTVLLCLGQLLLAWALYRFEFRDNAGRRPLLFIMLPQVAGLALFLLNVPTPLFGLGWIVVLFLCLCADRRRLRDQPRLVRLLLRGHAAMLWLALMLTVLGWGRLSILLCMAYAALVVCVLQTAGVLHLSRLISARLPGRGLPALAGGLGLAVAVPVALLALTAGAALWGVAYPGFSVLLELIAQRNISVGQTSFNLLQILLILSAFYACNSLVRVGRGLIAEYAADSGTSGAGLAGPLQTGYTYLLWMLFGLYVLNTLGVNLSSLSMIAGGLSVGIGLGLQNVIKDVIGGLQLLFGRTLREGDLIEIDKQVVTVKKIDLRHTRVETADSATIFVPNSELFSSRLTNWTRNGLEVRKSVSVGVAYGSDVSKVIRLLREIAAAQPHVLKTPAPLILLSDFGASTLDFVVHVWVDSVSFGLATTHGLRVEIERRFREEGVEIAFPQLDVHLHKAAEGTAEA